MKFSYYKQFVSYFFYFRYNYNSGSQIMRSQRPLMAFVLWSDNILYTGAVTNNCRQIFRIFVYLIHLQYSEKYLRIMTVGIFMLYTKVLEVYISSVWDFFFQNWLNTLVQTFYICENISNSDYPNTGKYCAAFAKEFYKTIEGKYNY